MRIQILPDGPDKEGRQDVGWKWHVFFFQL